MPSITCSIVTPDSLLLDEEPAQEIVVPAFDGQVGFLPGHARYLGALGCGTLIVHAGDSVRRFFVSGGFVQVTENHVTVVTDEAALPETFDAAAIRKEIARLEAESPTDPVDEAHRLRALAVARAQLDSAGNPG